MNWSYSLDLRSLSDDTTLTITAYDKAGNASTTTTIDNIIATKSNSSNVIKGTQLS